MKIENAIRNAKESLERIKSQKYFEEKTFVVMQTEAYIESLEKISTMMPDEIARIKAIPTYINDMRPVKDIKDKYGISWNDIKLIRGFQFPFEKGN